MKIKQLKVGPLKTLCYLLYDDTKQAILIDPGGDAEKILSTIRNLDLNVQHIIATHAHFDHISAVPKLKKEIDSDFLLHERGKQMFSHAEAMSHSYGSSEWKPPTPDDFLVDEDVLQVSDDLIFSILHTPGHSPGSTSLLWKEAAPYHLFSGDLVFPARPGRTDFTGGDPNAMQESVEKIAKLPPDTVVHPGHDWKFTIQKVREFV